MAKKVNRKKKTTKQQRTTQGAIIAGFVLAVIGLLGLISMISTQVGILGDYLRNAFLSLFAFMAVPACILVLLTGVLIIHAQRKTHVKKIILLWSMLFIMLLLLDSQTGFAHMALKERIHFAYENSQTATGGGVIGATMGYVFYQLLGKIGTFVLGIFGIIALLFVLFDLKIGPVKRWIVDEYQQIKAHVQEKIENRQLKKNMCDEEEQHAVVIHHQDYTKNDLEELSTSDDDIEMIPIWDGRQTHDMEADALTQIHEELHAEKTQAMEPQVSTSDSEQNEQELNHTNEDELLEEDHSDADIEKPYVFPSIELLHTAQNELNPAEEKAIIAGGKKIEDTLRNFNMEVKVKSISHGPTITRYELEPSPDIKISRIVNLQDNIALALAVSNIRIEAPIPWKSLIGIEVPNRYKSSIPLRDLLETTTFKEHKSALPLVLGQDVTGTPMIESIDKMPHLLICGATGSGKSVCINSIIMGLLYKSKPEDVKMILIDPKVVELSVYNRIPHLMIPVITDPKKASMALNWAVNEMERRYQLFAKFGVRDIEGYGKKHAEAPEMEKLPLLVIIIDELADLMMVASKEIEEHIARLAQMARAAGIHMIVATQRPSVDVITGTIKANIPSRIAFAVSSQTDSRTILDMAGAEKLLGKGDMLYFPSYYDKPKRIQGCFVSDEEVENVVRFIATSEEDRFHPKMMKAMETKEVGPIEEADPLLHEAIALVLAEQQASVSFLQRRLRLGYARAARMIDQLEELGIVSGRDGTKPRQVLMTKEQWNEGQEP